MVLPRKLACPKCGNNHFKVSLSEREIITEKTRGSRKIDIVEIFHVTCTRCGWASQVSTNPVANESSSFGGVKKFIKEHYRRKKTPPPKPKRPKTQQSKKGGRGWLHYRNRLID